MSLGPVYLIAHHRRSVSCVLALVVSFLLMGGMTWRLKKRTLSSKLFQVVLLNSESHDLFIILFCSTTYHFQHPGTADASVSRAQVTFFILFCFFFLCSFWTNKCFIVYLGSKVRTTGYVGEREDGDDKNGPKRRQTCHLGPNR